MPIDYEILRLIWWALLGILLAGFAIMDGFDLGVAILHPFIPRNENQRRVLLNAIGPVWEGNQIWLILGGGAIFAAWPALYAASFSGFYLAMFLVLLGLVLRPVAIVYRGKLEAWGWRRAWDWLFFASGFIPALIFGVAFGNLLLGAPFHFDETLNVIYEGGLLGLLSPFALLTGLVSVAMLTLQGATYLAAKTDGEVAERAAFVGALSAFALFVLFTAAGIWVAVGVDGYVLQSAVDPAGPSNPLSKTVVRQPWAWVDNYGKWPWTLAAPAIAYIGTATAALGLRYGASRTAFVGSSIAIAGVIATAGFSLFPFLLPSSTRPDHSLTVWDASSSQTTLTLMLAAVIVFLPIVLAYTSWVYHVLRGPVTEDAIEKGEDYHY